MKNKTFEEYKLQLFAEDPADPEPKDPEPADPKTYSQEDVDKMFAAYKEEQAKIFDEKWDKKFAKYKEDEQKKIDEAKKFAEMNAQEKAEAERDALQKKVEELEAKENLANMTTIARQMFAEAGVTASEAILSVLVSADAETTKSAVESYIEAYKGDVQNGVKNALKGEPPKAGGSNKLTKEDILKIENREERQRLINENLSLFQ